jgi:hypothetical protein
LWLIRTPPTELAKFVRALGAFCASAPLGYREQKNFATSLAEYDYILSLDADEALSEELKQSILEVKNDWKYDGYSFNRLNNYCGQWIYHCNWFPDRKIRLFIGERVRGVV